MEIRFATACDGLFLWVVYVIVVCIYSANILHQLGSGIEFRAWFAVVCVTVLTKGKECRHVGYLTCPYRYGWFAMGVVR